MINIDELQNLRDEFQNLFETTCKIYRFTTANDEMGGLSKEETLVSEAPCLFCATSGNLIFLANQIKPQDVAMVLLPINTDIREQDVILWEGKKFQVTAVVKRSREICKSVMVKTL